MRPWRERTHEERHLLNPAFCSALLWHAAKGATDSSTEPRTSLSFAEAFLVIPLVLHQKTRQSIPVRIDSSLPVWINSQPLIVASLPLRARSLVTYTKESITFGGSTQMFRLSRDEILYSPGFASALRNSLRDSSDEVRECMRKSEFLGRWFAHTGTPETIFTLFGIRP